MSFKKFSLAMLAISISTSVFACPDGQYSQCIAVNPFNGKCAQSICVPNGGTIVDGVSGGLSDLGQGVISLGNGSIQTSQKVGKGLMNSANQIDWSKVEKVDWGTAALVGSFILNGAACIASDGASPGVGISDSTVMCSENACACAALSLAIAVNRRSNMSDDEQKKTQNIVDNPQFAAILERPDMHYVVDSQLIQMGLDKFTTHTVVLKTRTGYYLNALDSTGNVSMLPSASFDPRVSDELFVLVDLNGGQLVSGDKIALKTRRAGYYVNAFDSVGNISAKKTASLNPLISDEVFTISKAGGGVIQFNSDKVFLQTRAGYYFNAFDSRGNVSAQKGAHPVWGISDELFQIDLAQ